MCECGSEKVLRIRRQEVETGKIIRDKLVCKDCGKEIKIGEDTSEDKQS